MNIKSIVRLALLSALASGATRAWANSYTIVDLGTNMYATGVDARGEVSGNRMNKLGMHERALIYGGGRLRQEPSGHATATAVGVNKGRVAGNIGATPVIWIHHSSAIDLALPGSSTEGTAAAINAGGDISGYFQAPSGTHCFLWSSATGASEDLGLLESGNECEAHGIDRRDHVYGRANTTPGGAWNAFEWANGQFSELAALISGKGDSEAVSGNATGDAVGWSTAETAWGELEHHAVLWHNGAVKDIARDDGWRSFATAINDDGVIVGGGIENAGDGDERHALRFDGKQFVELQHEVINIADWGLVTATGISDSGVIVGWGTRSGDGKNGKNHGFMLIPQ